MSLFTMLLLMVLKTGILIGHFITTIMLFRSLILLLLVHGPIYLRMGVALLAGLVLSSIFRSSQTHCLHWLDIVVRCRYRSLHDLIRGLRLSLLYESSSVKNPFLLDLAL